MKLHMDSSLFEHLVSLTEAYTGIDRVIIEKDYYVTAFLGVLSRKIPNLLFKGGTSLSKCYHLIQRFSEDIDLTLDSVSGSGGQRRALKQAIKETCNELGLNILNESDTRSRRDYNCYKIDYSPNKKDPAINPMLLVETTFIVKAFPSEEQLVSSFVCEYLNGVGLTDVIEKYELNPFPIRTQMLDRTLIDKVFAVCDYYLNESISRHSRHLYDITKIMGKIPINDELKSLFHLVRSERQTKNAHSPSADADFSIPRLLSEIIDKAVYKSDYENVTERVLYEECSYETAISGIRRLVDLKIFE